MTRAALPRSAAARLRQQLAAHLAVDVGEPVVAALEAVGELLVLDAEQVSLPDSDSDAAASAKPPAVKPANPPNVKPAPRPAVAKKAP